MRRLRVLRDFAGARGESATNPRSPGRCLWAALEAAIRTADAQAVKALPFWVAATGGIFLAVTFVKPISALVAVGTALFVLGVVLVFVVVVRRARRQGIPTTTALRRGARDALRFAWHLMP
jgi:hypothetical protein